MAELKSCPFCGGKVSLVLCDDEGNLHQSTIEETRNYAKQRNAAPVPVLEPILPLPALRDLVWQRPRLL